MFNICTRKVVVISQNILKNLQLILMGLDLNYTLMLLNKNMRTCFSVKALRKRRRGNRRQRKSCIAGCWVAWDPQTLEGKSYPSLESTSG